MTRFKCDTMPLYTLVKLIASFCYDIGTAVTKCEQSVTTVTNSEIFNLCVVKIHVVFRKTDVHSPAGEKWRI